MKIYLSSKMTGLKDFGKEKFEGMERQLKFNGYKHVFNPHSIGKKYGYKKDYAFYLKKSLEALLKCDTIYLFGNWKKSKGARLEYKIAKALNYNIKER